jgi:hypothetical protein
LVWRQFAPFFSIEYFDELYMALPFSGPRPTNDRRLLPKRWGSREARTAKVC